MWQEHLRQGLQKAQHWGPKAEALRRSMRDALRSDYLPNVRQVAKRYDDFRNGAADRPPRDRAGHQKRRKTPRGSSSKRAAPFAPTDPPRGCSMRPEERWGPWSGSFILRGGRAESNRKKH
jgi:hypothetical protein